MASVITWESCGGSRRFDSGKGVEGKAISLDQKVHVATFAGSDRDFRPVTKALQALHPGHFYL